MKLLVITAAILCSISAGVYAQDTGYHWYKGNTHSHSYWSDGNDFPEEVMEWYKSHGYNFISLTDHNTTDQSELWRKISKKPQVKMVEQQWFDAYLQKYGKDWVTTRKDSSGFSVKLKTLQEFRSRFEESGKFLIMPGEELTAFYKGEPVHMCLINLVTQLSPVDGTSKADLIQKNLDQFYAQREKTKQPMLVQINHPNFKNSLKFGDMSSLQGARFFEVFNGHPLVNNYGDSTTISTEKLWDKLLIAYTNAGKPLLYGIGSEDSHDYHGFATENASPGRAWIMVKATDLSPASLISAMDKGDFYASSGVTLRDVNFKNGKLNVLVKPEAGINYTIQFWGAKAGDTDGELLKEVKGNEASFQLVKNMLYVRAKVISSKLKENPFRKGDMETAWIQPVTFR